MANGNPEIHANHRFARDRPAVKLKCLGSYAGMQEGKASVGNRCSASCRLTSRSLLGILTF